MKKGYCKHFSGIGIGRETCSVGVDYLSVARKHTQDEIDWHNENYPDSSIESSALINRIPCKAVNCVTTCEKFVEPSDEEIAEHDAAIDQAVKQSIDRMANGLCVECGEPVQYMRQVIQAVYAEPCGHRHGVGNARGWNESKGWEAPESVHTDPDFGRYDEWDEIDRSLNQ